jgi:hypothetical protein
MFVLTKKILIVYIFEIPFLHSYSLHPRIAQLRLPVGLGMKHC